MKLCQQYGSPTNITIIIINIFPKTSLQINQPKYSYRKHFQLYSPNINQDFLRESRP